MSDFIAEIFSSILGFFMDRSRHGRTVAILIAAITIIAALVIFFTA